MVQPAPTAQIVQMAQVAQMVQMAQMGCMKLQGQYLMGVETAPRPRSDRLRMRGHPLHLGQAILIITSIKPTRRNLGGFSLVRPHQQLHLLLLKLRRVRGKNDPRLVVSSVFTNLMRITNQCTRFLQMVMLEAVWEISTTDERPRTIENPLLVPD